MEEKVVEFTGHQARGLTPHPGIVGEAIRAALRKAYGIEVYFTGSTYVNPSSAAEDILNVHFKRLLPPDEVLLHKPHKR